jgi:hypothetical protein
MCTAPRDFLKHLALFGRAPKGAPAPAPHGALPNGLEHGGSDGEAGAGAARGFH